MLIRQTLVIHISFSGRTHCFARRPTQDWWEPKGQFCFADMPFVAYSMKAPIQRTLWSSLFAFDISLPWSRPSIAVDYPSFTSILFQMMPECHYYVVRCVVKLDFITNNVMWISFIFTTYTHGGVLQHSSLLEHTFIGLNYWKINYISTLSCLVVADYAVALFVRSTAFPKQTSNIPAEQLDGYREIIRWLELQKLYKLYFFVNYSPIL